LPASSGAKAAAAAESIRAKLEYPPVNAKALAARHRTQTLAQRAVLDEWHTAVFRRSTCCVRNDLYAHAIDATACKFF